MFKIKNKTLDLCVLFLLCILFLLCTLLLSSCAPSRAVKADFAFQELALSQRELYANKHANSDFVPFFMQTSKKEWHFSARYQRESFWSDLKLALLVLVKIEEQNSLLITVLDPSGVAFGSVRIVNSQPKVDYQVLKSLHPRLEKLLLDCAQAFNIIFLDYQPSFETKLAPKLLGQTSESESKNLLRFRDSKQLKLKQSLEFSYSLPNFQLVQKDLYSSSNSLIWSLKFKGQRNWQEHEPLKQNSKEPFIIDLSVVGQYDVKLELIK